MTARLWIREATGQIREIDLASLVDGADDADGIVIGRDSGADLTVDDPSVSRFHARMTRDEHGWRLVDLGSSNKSFVNGDPVGDTPLHPGDLIRLGDTEIHLIDEVTRVENSGSQTQVLSALANESPLEARAAAVLNGLFRISQVARELDSSAELLDRSLQVLVEELGADRGAVLFIDGDALLCRAAYASHGQALRGFVLSQTIYREVMQSREAVLSRDTSVDERFQARQSIVGEEIRSILAAPIPVGDRIGAILYLDRLEGANGADSTQSRAFGTEELYGAAVAAEFLGNSLHAGSRLADLRNEKDVLVRTIIDTHPIIGNSTAIQGLREFIRRAAPTQSTVLIQGDTGTGKELVARGIHYGSPRAAHPFMAINCAAIPESLVESELFGHERGAFTGATARKAGKFEVASGGTVFLDEIGDLPLACQAKLLRLLEERRFERVGGTESVEVDVRIVAATHRDLAQESEEGAFREDLFYRLNVLQVTVPPLRDRRDDIDLLLDHFLDHFSERVGVGRKKLDDQAHKKLLEHPWPGNIRQLRNTIESCVVMASGETITVHDLPILPTPRRDQAAPAWHPRSLQEVEREHIERVLDAMEWNKSRTAEILGIERSTLYARIRNHELKPPAER